MGHKCWLVLFPTIYEAHAIVPIAQMGKTEAQRGEWEPVLFNGILVSVCISGYALTCIILTLTTSLWDCWPYPLPTGVKIGWDPLAWNWQKTSWDFSLSVQTPILVPATLLTRKLCHLGGYLVVQRWGHALDQYSSNGGKQQMEGVVWRKKEPRCSFLMIPNCLALGRWSWIGPIREGMGGNGEQSSLDVLTWWLLGTSWEGCPGDNREHGLDPRVNIWGKSSRVVGRALALVSNLSEFKFLFHHLWLCDLGQVTKLPEPQHPHLWSRDKNSACLPESFHWAQHQIVSYLWYYFGISQERMRDHGLSDLTKARAQKPEIRVRKRKWSQSQKVKVFPEGSWGTQCNQNKRDVTVAGFTSLCLGRKDSLR